MNSSYQTEQWVPYPVETVFAFFANPENLPALMPGWQKARIEHASIVPPERSAARTPMAGAGSRITLSFRPFRGAPFRVRWEAEITEFVLNSHFTDCQVKGPFAFWHHAHRLRNVDRAGINITVIVDRVEYKPPMGPLGRLVERLFLKKQLESTFAYRKSQTIRLLAEQAKLVLDPPLKKSKLA